MNGGFHVNDPTYCACGVVARRSAGLAVQPRLGILPQRRTRLGRRGLARTASSRKAVKSGGSGELQKLAITLMDGEDDRISPSLIVIRKILIRKVQLPITIASCSSY